jgi:hypothetical protein
MCRTSCRRTPRRLRQRAGRADRRLLHAASREQCYGDTAAYSITAKIPTSHVCLSLDYCDTGGKIVFQSVFMSTITQPRALASSSALLSLPKAE